MSTNEIFTKGHNVDKSCVFRIKTVWEEGCFQLFVIENTNSWFTLVTKEQVRAFAERHELDVEVYLKNLKEFLISEDDSSTTFDVTGKQFVMYRQLKTAINKKISSLTGNYRIIYFLTNIEKLTYQDTVETIIDDLVIKQKGILKKLEIIEEQKSESERQKVIYQQKCEEFVEMKHRADRKMYSAFTLILNEKKHRIQFLTELLEEYKNEGKSKFGTLLPSKTPLNQNRKANKKVKTEETQINTNDSLPGTSKISQKKVMECVSESESSDGYNTDEEKKLKVHLENNTVCTSSKDDLDFLGDSSPPPSLAKRPKRNRNADTISSLLDSPKKEIKVKTKMNETKVESMEVQHDNSDNESQPLAFSTQDLWERM